MQAERKKLFDYINEISFSIDDMLLYLDTHPEDEKALAYIKELVSCRKNAMREYQEKYMPLVIDGTDTDSCWKWSVSPWPWERGYC